MISLLEPEAAPTAPSHLGTLTARGFVRPRDGDAFAFRHVLVQQAVYRAAPKRLRAELHERFADRLERTAGELPELDEFVGYHLEQAYRLRSDLGENDRRTERLAEDGGRRLGSAGIRAIKRGDLPATANLLGRATTLLTTGNALRREMLCDLAITRHGLRDPGAAIELLTEAIAESQKAGDRRIGARAGIELAYIRLRREPERTADDLLEAIRDGIPIFEIANDQRALGRAWLFAGWVHGGRRANHVAWADAAERALVHYRAAKWPTSICLGEIAVALYWGPTPVPDAIARCEQLLREESADRIGAAYLGTFLGGLFAQQGDFERARTLVESARATLEDLGHRAAALTYCATVSGEIELLAGDADVAVRILRTLCDEFDRTHDYSQLTSRASDLAEALVVQGQLEEAEEWTEIAERHAAADDVNAQMMWRPVRARILARRGEFAAAEKFACEGVAVSERTDDLNRRAEARRDLGEVLRLAGRAAEAASAFGQAIALFEQKGNLVSAVNVRSLQEDPALV